MSGSDSSTSKQKSILHISTQNPIIHPPITTQNDTVPINPKLNMSPLKQTHAVPVSPTLNISPLKQTPIVRIIRDKSVIPGEAVVPIMDRSSIKNDHLTDPYLVLFIEKNIIQNDYYMKNFNGNQYSTLLVYNFYNLPVDDNTAKIFKIGEIGIRECLDLGTSFKDFYDVYIGKYIMRIIFPKTLIKTLIYRNIIKFRDNKGNFVLLHPNIVDEYGDMDIFNNLISRENYEKYIVEPEDLQSIMDKEVVSQNLLKDGLIIPPYAKDYIEYMNMNLGYTFSINTNKQFDGNGNLDNFSDSQILTSLNIYFLYQNRSDLINKVLIYIWGKMMVP